MSYKTHSFSTIYNDHSVCSDCGACTCHTPDLVKMLCADVYSGSYMTFNHETNDDLMTPVKKALELLGKELAEFKSDVKMVSDFERRRTALYWVQANFSNVISPQVKMELAESTENFLRTGKFHNKKETD